MQTAEVVVVVTTEETLEDPEEESDVVPVVSELEVEGPPCEAVQSGPLSPPAGWHIEQ